ncbi:MAG: hypothetical protein GF411_15920 [Candidatus Lokiarchaeota archaeon]|nr:hypothetical protein [Candidatus Lokiarchaeota archaeon]
MTNDGTIPNETNHREAELFESISHPTRIEILYALHEGSFGFAALKRKVGLSSSGNLQHHLSKLSTLVITDTHGDYMLSDEGREAIYAIGSVRKRIKRKQGTDPLIVLVTTLVYYLIQMNLPFITGTVNPMTPISALVGSVAFGLIFYLVFSYAMNRALDTIEDEKDSIAN